MDSTGFHPGRELEGVLPSPSPVGTLQVDRVGALLPGLLVAAGQWLQLLAALKHHSEHTCRHSAVHTGPEAP